MSSTGSQQQFAQSELLLIVDNKLCFNINTMDENKSKNISDHLANERTFLAWIRTAIGIMAFGFVVVKFSLFVKQLSIILGKEQVIHSRGYSAVIGILLVASGAVTTLMAYIRYRRTEQQINKADFRNSSWLLSLLAIFIILISLLLICYVVESI